MPMSEKKSIREKSIRELTKAALCTAAVALGIALYVVEVSSCANTKGSPTGGPKDTIPPVVLSVIPELNTTSFPREKQDIRIFFNEFVQLKDANKNILLSPPLSKKIKTKIKGKSIVVEFPLPLDSARTYTIYFGSAIADNNEGNPLLGYTYAFSTGSAIDSMLVSGRVVENETLKSVKR
ncbi:MAG: Ig-like domain-containing protein [Candidatus Egerieousia sp.]|nr:Ig-like domain-containing protein [Candidatus Egerieousia sp.]